MNALSLSRNQVQRNLGINKPSAEVLNIRGVRTFVRKCGDQKSYEAVVLVHGNPGASEDWDSLIPQAGDFARVIAPDMPGYGKSDRPRKFDYTIEGYARHLGMILDELNIYRVHFILHDFGGAWALQWAAWHPYRVGSIVLINTGHMPGYKWHKFARIWRTPILGELFQLAASRGMLRLLLNRENPKPFPDHFIDRVHANSDWGHKRAVLRLYRSTPDLSARTLPIALSLKHSQFPGLVLWGEQDTFLPFRCAYEQSNYLNAEVHTLPNCGHWPMIDEPEAVNKLVIPFLRKQLNIQ